MRQLRNRARLALKTFPEFPALGEMFGEDLDGDVAVEPGIAGAIHFTHTTRTQRGQNFIRPEPDARG